MPPPARPDVVDRSELVARLASLSERKLTLLAAPTGYGKTTLLTHWAAAETRPVAWLALGPTDGHPERFWALVGEALAVACPDLRPYARAFRGRRVALDRAIPLLMNAIAESPDQVVLVLDDYHTLSGTGCHDTVALFLEHLPETIRVVIASRFDPPLFLARLRARGELGELRLGDLRFARGEIDELLRRVAGVALEDTDLSLLEGRTEGWPAGVYLAGLSLREAEDSSAFVRAFAGSNRHVVDYLGEEVLAALRDELRTFLIRTSILDRLSGPLCDAVLERDDSSELLDELAQSLLFLAPLDGRRTWFRCHRLFAELLRFELARTEPELTAELHRRASEACEELGLLVEAVRHADAAGDSRRAREIVARHRLDLIRLGRHDDVRAMLAAAGESRPGFGTGVPRLEAALVRVVSPSDDVGARLAAARELAQFVETVPDWPTAPLMRRMAVAALGYGLFMSGRPAEARDTLAEIDTAAAVVAPAATMLGAAVRSLACARIALHGEAASFARSAAEIAERFGLRGTADAAFVFVALAGALLRSGRPATAVDLLRQARAVSERDALTHAYATLSLAAARAEHDESATRALVSAARETIERAPDPGMLAAFADEVEARLQPRARKPGAMPEELGDAELRVLRLLTTRMTQREIARELYLSLNTVKTHARTIYRKLAVSSRADAIRVARALKLV